MSASAVALLQAAPATQTLSPIPPPHAFPLSPFRSLPLLCPLPSLSTVWKWEGRVQGGWEREGV